MECILRRVRLLLILFSASLICPAQTPQEKSAVAGRAVSAATGAPLKKVVVSLEPFSAAGGVNSEHAVASGTTGADGSFLLPDVPPGSYLLIARRTGYLDQGYGASVPQTVGRPIEVAPGHSVSGLTVRLTPQSLLAGKVVDEDGDPVPLAHMVVLRVSYPGGHRRLIEVANADSQDDGSFVAGDLVPGRYYLSAGMQRDHFVPTYYPNALDPENAEPLQVAAGAELRGLTLRLRPRPSFHIRGRAVYEGGSEAAGRFSLQLLPAPGHIPGTPNRSIRTADDGRFDLDGVVAGSYLLQGAPRQGAVAGPVNVAVAENDVDGLVVRVGPGATVDGRIIGGKAGSVTLVPQQREYADTVAVERDGQFHFSNLSAAMHTIEVNGLPDGSFVKSVRFGDRAVPGGVLDLRSGGGELVIEVSPDAGQVSGIVRREGEPAPGALVQIWPDGVDDARATRTDAHGEFRFPSIPPGDYRLIAWQDLDDELADYPAFRARFESVALKVAERASERLDLELTPRQAIEAEAARLK